MRPGDVVLNLGAGPGLLGYFALQAGAARVYAIEQSNIIHDAQEVAEANGWGDRIIFLCDNSLQVVLPERVDVIVSFGCLGLDENILRFPSMPRHASSRNTAGSFPNLWISSSRPPMTAISIEPPLASGAPISTA